MPTTVTALPNRHTIRDDVKIIVDRLEVSRSMGVQPQDCTEMVIRTIAVAYPYSRAVDITPLNRLLVDHMLHCITDITSPHIKCRYHKHSVIRILTLLWAIPSYYSDDADAMASLM